MSFVGHKWLFMLCLLSKYRNLTFYCMLLWLQVTKLPFNVKSEGFIFWFSFYVIILLSAIACFLMKS